MQIQINYAHVDKSPAIDEKVEQEVQHALKHFEDQVTRVEVHLHDDNGAQKHGVDKRCVIEARLAGFQPTAIESTDDDLYTAIHKAAGKLERAVRHMIERHDAHNKGH